MVKSAGWSSAICLESCRRHFHIKILLYTQWCTPEPAFKSVPLARELQRRGHEVRILTGFPSYPGGRLYPGYRLRFSQREALDGVKVLRAPLYPSHDASSVRRALSYLSFMMSSAPALCCGWRPDVVYVYNLVTLGAVAALNRRLRSVPYVVDIQDLWPDSVFSSGMGSDMMRRPVEWLCRLTYRHASRLVVLSPGFKTELARRGVPEQKMEVVFNWYDAEAEALMPEGDTADPEPALAGRFNILYAGNLGAAQGLRAVVDAAARTFRTHPAIQWVFLGTGIEEEALKAHAASVAPNSTLFLPPRSRVGALKLMRQADVLLVHLRDDPLFRITIPSKTQACLAVGKPILAGLRGDAAELVLDADAGVVCEPESSEAMAASASRLAGLSQARLMELGQSGARFYQSRLSMAHGVQRIEEVLLEASKL